MQPSKTDNELLLEFRSGCDDAFAELIRRHRPLVSGVCGRVLSNSADCDDAVQIVFLTLARKAETLIAHDALDGWLRQTAQFVAQRFRASAQLRRKREGDAMPREDGNNELCDACRDEWLEIAPILQRELRALPPLYRRPLVLHYLEGLTQSDVARALGCSYGTVSGRLSRARELLRERLASRGIAVPVALVAALAPRLAAACDGVRDESTWRASIAAPATAVKGESHANAFSAWGAWGIYVYPQLCALMLFLCVISSWR